MRMLGFLVLSGTLGLGAVGLAACANDATGPDAAVAKRCEYTDYWGRPAVCTSTTGYEPGGGRCPSVDGCNEVGCTNGTLESNAGACFCLPPDAGVSALFFPGQTKTLDDGCTVCSCVTNGVGIRGFQTKCDPSACR